jgi:acetoacetyl-CoA synthetase
MSIEPLWKPSEERISRSNMRRFIDEYADLIGGDDYDACYAWSIAQPGEFWSAAWDFCGLRGDRKGSPTVVDFDRMPGARWFPGATLNYAQNLLGPGRDGPAIVFTNERGERRELSWDELKRQVTCVARGLRELGVLPGDRVAGLLPNLPETAVAMIATASIGAIWSSCSPEFGLNGVLERFGQIEPKVLFAVDEYFYNGRRIGRSTEVLQLAEQLPGLEAVVHVSYPGGSASVATAPRALSYDTLIEQSPDFSEPEFDPFAFDHPLFIVYTSGTTGAPKSIVHGAGGTLLQHKKEHVLHTDIKPGDKVFYFTTCGWMMWNWLMSTLASGATAVLYDGMPLHPDPGVLWRMADTESVKVFGTSAKYLSALEKTGYRPARHHGLNELETVLSTGSPLAGSSFDFVYRQIKGDVRLSSIAGGTDLISCFALGNPILPVYRGELQCRGLGMKVAVFDDHGRSVRGEKGELVCTAPFPSMPTGFWNDADGAKYRQAYFARFPNIWCHGDYAALTEHDGMILFGRSDTVLNPGGVRIGTAEIYRVVESLPEVGESVAVGQDFDDDVRIILFVRTQPGVELDAALEERIRSALRTRASPRHVPAKIIAVSDIPRTLSGKIVEVAVRELVNGRGVTNLDALANPEALDEFRNRPELDQ